VSGAKLERSCQPAAAAGATNPRDARRTPSERVEETPVGRSFIKVMIPAVIAFTFLAGPTAADDGPKSRKFDAHGVKIHFFEQGRGEPVVLIHGLHSSADINWRLTGIFADLAQDHRVIALDLPGHGRSDRPEKDEAYGLQLVRDVILLLDHLKIEKAHIVGYSLGGMVALKLVAQHPDRVLSATIGGMGWFRDGSALQKFWEQVPERPGQRTPSAFIRNVGKLALSEKELKQIDVPVEILIGDHDPVKPLYVAPLRPKRRDWPVIEIEDAGHFSCIVKKPFRLELVAWVRKQSEKVKG
jgi:pimeloyl-ACP methyl ester carboxylesterase